MAPVAIAGKIDHAIGQLDKVLAGALDEVVDPLLQHERAEQLAAQE